MGLAGLDEKRDASQGPLLMLPLCSRDDIRRPTLRSRPEKREPNLLGFGARCGTVSVLQMIWRFTHSLTIVLLLPLLYDVDIAILSHCS